MIYLYAVAESDAAGPDALGLEDRPVRRLRARHLAGLYSEHERTDFDPLPDALWRHDQVVEAAMRLGSVLPARFGTTFAGQSALAARLDSEQPRLQRALEHVRGCVELAVRVSLPESRLPASRSGHAYITARLARRQSHQAVAERTLVPLAAYAVRSHTPGSSSDGDTLRASYLVRRPEIERFASRVREIAQCHDELSLSCTGPWPPYSFVEEDG